MREICTALVVMALLVTAASPGDFLSGSTTCPASGAAQVSTTANNVYQLVVAAKLANVGTVYLGQSGVTTATGIPLTPGSSFNLTKPNPGITPHTLYFACA